jgi:hypothetical protein
MRLEVEGPLKDITEFREQLDGTERDSTYEIGAVEEKRTDLFEPPSLRYVPLVEFLIIFSAEIAVRVAEETAKKIIEKARNFPKIRIKFIVEHPEEKELEGKAERNSE